MVLMTLERGGYLPSPSIDLLAVEIGHLAAQHTTAEIFVITAGDQTEPHRDGVVFRAGAPVRIHRHALEQSLGLVGVRYSVGDNYWSIVI